MIKKVNKLKLKKNQLKINQQKQQSKGCPYQLELLNMISKNIQKRAEYSTR
jgi:hypothetical protein